MQYFIKLILSVLFTISFANAKSISALVGECDDLNIAQSCYLAANEYGELEEEEKGLNYLYKSCDLGYSYGCDFIGMLYFNDGDFKGAIPYFKKACDLGSYDSCGNLGGAYQAAGQYSKAVTYLKMACDNKIAVACRNLGGEYFFGRGVPEDLKKAEELLSVGCIFDRSPRSCYILGTLYNKRGIENDSVEDIEKAIKAFKVSCQQLYANSCDVVKDLKKVIGQ